MKLVKLMALFLFLCIDSSPFSRPSSYHRICTPRTMKLQKKKTFKTTEENRREEKLVCIHFISQFCCCQASSLLDKNICSSTSFEAYPNTLSYSAIDHS